MAAGEVALRSPASPTSLELTLENKKLEEAQKECIQALLRVTDRREDAIGYVAIVNGNVASADVYGSHGLFMKLWPTLLKGSAVQALAEKSGDKNAKPVPGTDAVHAFLDGLEQGKPTAKPVGAGLRLEERDSAKGVVFETRTGSDDKEALLRRSYIAK
jgi:hypothetical protein